MTYEKDQYVSELSDYSSSYGMIGNKTYDVRNIVGAPGSYGNGSHDSIYGDHVSSLVFRTYGNYWNLLPFHKQYRPIGYQPHWFQASDFIELEFAQPVYPTKLQLYETFCPGGLTRVLISDLGTEIPKGTPHLSTWKVIWTQPSFVGRHLYSVAMPDLPKHNKSSIATYRVRLEFDDKLAEYYHELDGVKLFGYPWRDGIAASEYLLKRIKKMVSVSVPTEMLKNLKLESSDTNRKELEELKPKTDAVSEKENEFDKLPLEVIQIILDFVVDMGQRAQVSQVNKLFHRVVTNPTAIKELNLQPYYAKISKETLINLSSIHGPSITKLDLSWTGYTHSCVTSKVAAESLEFLPNLLELKCRNCHSFVNDEFLTSLSTNCLKLKVMIFNTDLLNLHLIINRVAPKLSFRSKV